MKEEKKSCNLGYVLLWSKSASSHRTDANAAEFEEERNAFPDINNDYHDQSLEDLKPEPLWC